MEYLQLKDDLYSNHMPYMSMQLGTDDNPDVIDANTYTVKSLI